MNSTTREAVPSFSSPFIGWVVLCCACVVALWFEFREGIEAMAIVWTTSEDFSHGALIPLIALFFIWQKRHHLSQLVTSQNGIAKGAWWGVLFVAAGAALNLVGKLATLQILQQYGLVISIHGLALAIIGWRGIRIIWAPLLLLWMMIPLPNFFLNSLSLNLQLISSQFGVWVIRLFGITVFLEGNVIDLGVYKLQVAEACSGLRYLFPLMTIGFIMAYLFKVETWKRVLVFVSSIPITILMNSLRIGVIGITVDRWGVKMAEGFLHDFQGWVVFMFSSAILLVEVVVLARIGKERRHWRDVFGLDTHRPKVMVSYVQFQWPRAFVLGTAVVVAAACLIVLLPERSEAIPVRDNFVSFPQSIGPWTGHRDQLEAIYVDTLKFDDYILANYRRGREQINVYVGWYNSQRSGQSAHSPRSCLPGGGWRIEDSSVISVKGISVGGVPLMVNQALIRNGSQQQLVYYWFQQRGRVITNEYAVKWYLFWDAFTRNRSDGALVRLIIPITADINTEQAEATLTEFLQSVVPELPRFIPG